MGAHEMAMRAWLPSRGVSLYSSGDVESFIGSISRSQFPKNCFDFYLALLSLVLLTMELGVMCWANRFKGIVQLEAERPF